MFLAEYHLLCAINNLQFDVIVWLLSQRPPCPCSERSFLMALSRKNLDLLDLLLDYDVPYDEEACLRHLREAEPYDAAFAERVEAMLGELWA
jgi:hypothetical protein